MTDDAIRAEASKMLRAAGIDFSMANNAKVYRSELSVIDALVTVDIHVEIPKKEDA